MSNKDGITYESLDAWLEHGRMLFGEDYNGWRFVCPACKKVRSEGSAIAR
jgi:hypothetical protein